MKISNKYKRMARIYKRFTIGFNCDLSDKALLSMYLYESKGVGNLGSTIFQDVAVNGYALGKKWMDVTITSWKEDIKQGLLLKEELIKDNYPEWFLTKIGI